MASNGKATKQEVMEANLGGVDQYQAMYWNNPVPRKEFQVVVDEHAKAINLIQDAVAGVGNDKGELLKPGLIHTVVSLDLSFRFLMEKLGIKGEELQTWIRANQPQAQQMVNEAAQGGSMPPAEKPLVTLD